MGRTDERRWNDRGEKMKDRGEKMKDRGEKMKDEGDKMDLDRRGRTDGKKGRKKEQSTTEKL